MKQSSIMKRRKTRTSSEASNPTSSPSPHQEKKVAKTTAISSSSSATLKKSITITAETKASTLNIEDTEMEKRDAAKDVDSFQSACGEISKLVEEIQDLKKQGKEPTCPEIAEKRIRCTLLFIMLQKLNRLCHVRCKKARDTTQEAKQKVDSVHLKLQNLLYEVMHLKKEITKCLEFKSKHEEIELVDEEEFFEQAPEEVSKPDITKEDPHQLMLARLDWELQQRKSLAAQKEEFLNKKGTLSKEIQQKKEYLDSLQPGLESILKATLPVQEYLNMPLDAKKLQHESARYLPRPLYVLFVQSSAYWEACNPNMEVRIQGDIEAAKAELETKANQGEMESESDQETEAIDETRSRSKHRRKKEESRLKEKQKSLLKKHPLQIIIQINCKSQATVTLQFAYLTALNVVVVTLSLSVEELDDKPVLSNRTLLLPDSMLSCLFPGDHGNTTPNPTNQFQLTRLGMKNFSAYIPNIGRPYVWAQKICGLDFLPETPGDVLAESSVSSSHMEITVKAVRTRVLARLALQRQLTSLEKLVVPISKKSSQMFPEKVIARLLSWKPLALTDFTELHQSKGFTSDQLIDENDMFFTAVFERNTSQLHAVVAIPQEYPSRPPLFSVCLKDGDTVVRDNTTESVEEEVNVFYGELTEHDFSSNLLANQMLRLQMCFDVVFECRAVERGGSISPERLFIRQKRGRDRRLPLKYVPEHRRFTQR